MMLHALLTAYSFANSYNFVLILAMVRTRARRGPLPGSAVKTKRVATPVYCQDFLGEQLKEMIVQHGCEKAFDLGWL